MSGKGSKRRAGKLGAYARGYDAIDWSKGRKPAAPRKATIEEILVKDYATKPDWVIPSLREILDPKWCQLTEGSPVVEELTDRENATLNDMVRRQSCCSGRNGCTNPPVEEHTCPYAEDINGDSETLCTCCADCQHECAMDI